VFASVWLSRELALCRQLDAFLDNHRTPALVLTITLTALGFLAFLGSAVWGILAGGGVFTSEEIERLIREHEEGQRAATAEALPARSEPCVPTAPVQEVAEMMARRLEEPGQVARWTKSRFRGAARSRSVDVTLSAHAFRSAVRCRMWRWNRELRFVFPMAAGALVTMAGLVSLTSVLGGAWVVLLWLPLLAHVTARIVLGFPRAESSARA
jgi:hypothetical protein